MSGNFNALLENMMLIIKNEASNKDESMYAAVDYNKAIITEDTLVCNEKNEKKRIVKNCCNFITLSNRA